MRRRAVTMKNVTGARLTTVAPDCAQIERLGLPDSAVDSFTAVFECLSSKGDNETNEKGGEAQAD